MGAFLIICVVIALLIAGGVAISVHLHNTSIKGQRLSHRHKISVAKIAMSNTHPGLF